MNLAKNEATKRNKSKTIDELEKKFNLECQIIPSYYNLIVLNICLLLHREGCFRFISDKDI